MICRLSIVFVLGLASFPALADDFADQSLAIFDGESLKGWEGNRSWFRVEQGSIVAGSSERRIPHNEFLCTTQNYDNFELRLEAKLVGDGKNAGVQFRSQRVPDSTEVSGYQADIGFIGRRCIWGSLYDESRRRKMLVQTDRDLGKELVKPGEWNSIRLICEGPHIQIFVNDRQTADYTEQDAEIPQHGVIGLQIHSGPASEAWYRNIRVRQL